MLSTEYGESILKRNAMDIEAYIYEHASAEANIVEVAAAFLDNDVNH